jgi:hypothetical protein
LSTLRWIEVAHDEISSMTRSKDLELQLSSVKSFLFNLDIFEKAFIYQIPTSLVIPTVLYSIFYSADKELKYGLYLYQYSYVISAAYVSGIVPAVLTLIILMGCFISLFYVVNRFFPDSLIAKQKNRLHKCYLFINQYVSLTKLSSKERPAADVSYDSSASASARPVGSHTDESGEKPPSANADGDTRNNSVRPQLIAYGSMKKYAWEFACRSAIFVSLTAFVFAVYAGYVTARLSANEKYTVFLEIALSLFNLTFLFTLVPSLLKYLENYTHFTLSELTLFYIHLAIMSTIVAPIMAILFINVQCFNYLFVPDDEISVIYENIYCKNYGKGKFNDRQDCVQTFNERLNSQISYAYELVTAKFTPSVVYNNQCSDAVITSYAPIVLYGAIFSVIANALMFLIALLVSYESIPVTLRVLFYKICWPKNIDYVPVMQILGSIISNMIKLISLGKLSSN